MVYPDVEKLYALRRELRAVRAIEMASTKLVKEGKLESVGPQRAGTGPYTKKLEVRALGRGSEKLLLIRPCVSGSGKGLRSA